MAQNIVLSLLLLANLCEAALRLDSTRTAPHRCQCSCGLTNERPMARIVGGQTTQFNQFPWIVGLLFKGHHYCSGSIISDKYVLTAGHCVRGINVRSLKVMVGDHLRSFPVETKSKAYQAVHINIHPKFNSSTFESDLALIKLGSKVPYKWYARPICLPVSGIDYVGMFGTVAGWGRTEEKGDTADYLQFAKVPVFSNEACKQMRYSAHEISKNMICAGYKRGGADSCSGDSGGPFMIKGRDGKMVLAGVVSWGLGCGRIGLPGVYTRVSNFLSWIEVNTKDSCFCGVREGRRGQQ